MIRNKDVISAIEQVFPPRYQEDFDNTGLQVGSIYRHCTGVVLCVDVTPEIVIEASERNCNLIISHHPLIFHPLKNIGSFGRINQSIIKAIRNDICIYSAHTSADNTPGEGVSWHLGRRLGLSGITALQAHGPEGIGSGVVGDLAEPMPQHEFVEYVKQLLHVDVARCSKLNPDKLIGRVGLCGGAGSFLIPDAIEAHADAFICSDCRHNLFLDYSDSLLLVDIGHYESELCTKEMFYRIIKEKFPNFALYYSQVETNPITYL